MDAKRYDIGGACLALVKRGQGSPTVILEGGLLAGREAWEPVAREISLHNPVVMYDRAGRGESDPGLTPRHGQRMAAELHALLEAAGIPGPYLMVGQSLGGLIVRLFAWQYPEDTAGLLLVDPTHEDQFDLIAHLLPPPDPYDSPALQNFRSFWSGGYRDPAQNQEKVDFLQTCAQAREVNSLARVPLLILAAGEGMNRFGLAPEIARRLSQVMFSLHEQTARLSANSSLVVVPGAGHFIQQDRPFTVVWGITQVLASIRSGMPLQALVEKDRQP